MAKRGEIVNSQDLTIREQAFCRHYLANGFRATPAYRAAFPDAAPGTASVEAWQYLVKPRVRLFIAREVNKLFAKLEATGREMVGRVVQDARSDVRELYDEDGHLLPPQLWPDSVANSVESFELKPDGSYKVKFVSKLQARRTVLEITGTLRDQSREDVSILARAIRGDLGLRDGDEA